MEQGRWFCRAIVLAGVITLTMAVAWSQQRRQLPGQPPGGRVPPIISGETTPPAPPTISRKMLRASFEQLQKDVAELAELALALKEEISQANEDVLPLSGVKKAEEIEKLAKKIQGRIKNL